MSKMSNLDLVLDEMITTGQKMIDAATALKEMFSETAPEMSKVETKTKKKEAPAKSRCFSLARPEGLEPPTF